MPQNQECLIYLLELQFYIDQIDNGSKSTALVYPTFLPAIADTWSEFNKVFNWNVQKEHKQKTWF